ncbi:MAG TPA: pyrrolo-quinoline quinone, partial [Terriglobia bacterium]|nr:pyrrolo-quinoline quinone [Terriglobia bacterium]
YPLWKRSFIDPANGITAVPSSDEGCGDLVPEIGITGTPVIDPSSNTLYVVANTKEKGTYYQRLHAINVGNGADKFGGPVVIQASGGGQSFNPFLESQRPGLLLQNGDVYIGWASHCDYGPYTGWIMAYDAKSLQQLGAIATTTNYQLGGVWQAGSGVAGDGAGNVFVATGNGTFDADQSGSDYGDSILRLTLNGGQLGVQDYFAPDDQAYLDQYDIDLGSGGVLVLPKQPGSHPNLLVASGKEGTVYLADRTNLGHYSSSSNNNLQTLYFAVGGMFGMPAYWNSNVYFWGSYDFIKAFRLTNGSLSTSATSEGPDQAGYPGATPSISSNSKTNGIAWAIQSDAYGSNGPAVLHAYDATNLANELYSSSQNPARDSPGAAVKFAVPTIANGKVYVGTEHQVSVYGLLGQR